jgi:hypothetical protein
MSSNKKRVDNLLLSTLLTLGLPVERLRFAGEAEAFITFQIISGSETEFADDDGQAYEYLYRVDIFSKTDYITLMRRAEKALKAAGFYGITVNAEIYEHDTGFYHIPLDIYYMEG